MSDIHFQALLPDGWERARGYSYGAVSSGSRVVHIAGQIGAPGNFGEQWERALGKVVEVMATAGGTAENITMMRIYVTDMAAYQSAGAALGEAWKKHMGRHFPAMTLVAVTALVSDQALVEIEAEGLLP